MNTFLEKTKARALEAHEKTKASMENARLRAMEAKAGLDAARVRALEATTRADAVSGGSRSPHTPSHGASQRRSSGQSAYSPRRSPVHAPAAREPTRRERRAATLMQRRFRDARGRFQARARLVVALQAQASFGRAMTEAAYGLCAAEKLYVAELTPPSPRHFLDTSQTPPGHFLDTS